MYSLVCSLQACNNKHCFLKYHSTVLYTLFHLTFLRRRWVYGGYAYQQRGSEGLPRFIIPSTISVLTGAQAPCAHVAAKRRRFLPTNLNPIPYPPSDAAQVRPKAEDHALDVVPRVALNLVSQKMEGNAANVLQPCGGKGYWPHEPTVGKVGLGVKLVQDAVSLLLTPFSNLRTLVLEQCAGYR